MTSVKILVKSDVEKMAASVKSQRGMGSVVFTAREAETLLEAALSSFDFSPKAPVAPPSAHGAEAYRRGFGDALRMARDELDDEALSPEKLTQRFEALEETEKAIRAKVSKKLDGGAECPTCEGRGEYQEHHPWGDRTAAETLTCSSCMGTGVARVEPPKAPEHPLDRFKGAAGNLSAIAKMQRAVGMRDRPKLDQICPPTLFQRIPAMETVRAFVEGQNPDFVVIRIEEMFGMNEFGMNELHFELEARNGSGARRAMRVSRAMIEKIGRY